MEPNNNNNPPPSNPNPDHLLHVDDNRYEPLPPHHHGYHPHHAPLPQQQPPPQHGGPHGGGGQHPAHEHQHQPYGGYPNYNHHGGGYATAVNYQNYANYPPPAPAAAHPPPHQHQHPGHQQHGAVGHQHQQQHHQYHPPIAYQYNEQMTTTNAAAASAVGVGAYNYPPGMEPATMPKAMEYHPYPPPPTVVPQPKQSPPHQPQQQQQQEVVTQIYLGPVPTQPQQENTHMQQLQQSPQLQEQPPQMQQHLEKQEPPPPAPMEQEMVLPAPVEPTPVVEPVQTVQPSQIVAEEVPTKEPVDEMTPMEEDATTNPVKEEMPMGEPPAPTEADVVATQGVEGLPQEQPDTMAEPTDSEKEQAATEEAGTDVASQVNAEQATDQDQGEMDQGENNVNCAETGQAAMPALPAAEETKEQKKRPKRKKTTKEDTFPFETIITALEKYRQSSKSNRKNSLSIPKSHSLFTEIISSLVENGIEEEADKLWEANFEKLQQYKERTGDCDVPFTDKTLGWWVKRQRELHAKLSKTTTTSQTNTTKQLWTLHRSRFEKLSKLGFDFSTPMWDVRYRELMEYKKEHNHVSPPVNYPKLGIWVINQRFNIKDMCKERVEALDMLGFVWNHNRKNRSQARWDSKYEELLDYIKENGHCNVPATYRHSPLGTWVGKQREEYKKLKEKKSSQLDKYRIDKLNAVKFQWSLQSWTVISWDDRFEALKRFKEKYGHTKIPRNHPDFGNWPIYQKTQYKLFKEGKKSKITKEKVEKLTQIGFFDAKEPTQVQDQPLIAKPPEFQGGVYDTSWY